PVEEHDRRAFALVEMGQTQAGGLPIAGREAEIGQALEAIVGCAVRLGHGARDYTRGPGCAVARARAPACVARSSPRCARATAREIARSRSAHLRASTTRPP